MNTRGNSQPIPLSMLHAHSRSRPSVYREAAQGWASSTAVMSPREPTASREKLSLPAKSDGYDRSRKQKQTVKDCACLFLVWCEGWRNDPVGFRFFFFNSYSQQQLI